ncbi:nickel-binding protein [Azospirillum sp. sgz302134]
MAIVVIERTFQDRIDGAALLDMDRRNSWCLQAHRVGPIGHFVSRDGLRLCCVLHAPDAESVHLAGRTIGVPPAHRVWPAAAHGPVSGIDALSGRAGEAGRSLVVVERSFAEPIGFDDVQAAEDRGAWCLSVNRVEFLASWLALDGRRMICLYDAPDADTVVRTNTRLGLPFDRVWSAGLYASGTSAGASSAET